LASEAKEKEAQQMLKYMEKLEQEDKREREIKVAKTNELMKEVKKVNQAAQLVKHSKIEQEKLEDQKIAQ